MSSVVCTLAENDKLTNKIATLLPIVVKHILRVEKVVELKKGLRIALNRNESSLTFA